MFKVGIIGLKQNSYFLEQSEKYINYGKIISDIGEIVKSGVVRDILFAIERDHSLRIKAESLYTSGNIFDIYSYSVIKFGEAVRYALHDVKVALMKSDLPIIIRVNYQGKNFYVTGRVQKQVIAVIVLEERPFVVPPRRVYDAVLLSPDWELIRYENRCARFVGELPTEDTLFAGINANPLKAVYIETDVVQEYESQSWTLDSQFDDVLKMTNWPLIPPLKVINLISRLLHYTDRTIPAEKVDQEGCFKATKIPPEVLKIRRKEKPSDLLLRIIRGIESRV